ncbi:hypothetical protein HZA39_03300, partial [Candidatus Peregrinibacteria bacterium]|nr:hypothetical protein [Candidatus Peregrinibacteria bacterium]
NLSGDVTYLNVKYDGEIALKMAGKKLYLNLLKYPKAVEDNPQLAMLPALANKWYFVDSTPYEKQYGLGFTEKQVTPEQKQIEEEFFNTSLFKNLKYEGKEKVGNIDAYKYSGVFDKDAFYQFVLKASEINKTPATEAEKKDLKKALASFDMPAELLISANDEMLVGLKSTIAYKDPEQKADAIIKIDAKLIDINQSFTVEIPKDAVDLIKMFGGGA